MRTVSEKKTLTRSLYTLPYQLDLVYSNDQSRFLNDDTSTMLTSSEKVTIWSYTSIEKLATPKYCVKCLPQ